MLGGVAIAVSIDRGAISGAARHYGVAELALA